MLDYLSLTDAGGASVFLHGGGGGCAVSTVEGLVGISAPREVVRDRPQGHGSIVGTRWLADRVVMVQAECWGPTSQDALARFDEIAGAAFDTLATPRLLKWQRTGSGLALQQAEVRLAAPVQPPISGAGRFLRFQLQLRAPDPRAYDQQEVFVVGSGLSGSGGGRTYPLHYPYTFQPTGGGTLATVVGGNVPTPPVLTIYGACTNPQLQLDSTGERIVLAGSVGAGQTLEVDVARRTVKLNGSTSRLDMLSRTATTWWELPPGSQSVSLLASDFDADARVNMLYRPAYL